MIAPSTLAKKNKSELIEEYQKLLAQQDELKMAAQVAFEPGSAELIAKAKAYTAESVSRAFSEAKLAMAANFNQLGATLSDQLVTVQTDILKTLSTFEELQQAVELTRKQLEVQHQMRVAAETIDQLIAEYDTKKQQLESEFAAMRQSFDAEILTKRRDWQHEREEYEYAAKRDRERTQTVFEEERQSQKKELQARVDALKQQEAEQASLSEQVQEFPARLNRELEKKSQEVKGVIDAVWKDKLETARREWEAEKNMLELRIKVLEDQGKRQDTEITRLKQESELSHKKAQELAVKVIESGSVRACPSGDDRQAPKS